MVVENLVGISGQCYELAPQSRKNHEAHLELFNRTGFGEDSENYFLQAPYEDKIIKIFYDNPPSGREEIDKLVAISRFTPKNQKFFNQVAWIHDVVFEDSKIFALIIQRARGERLSNIVCYKTLTWDKRLTIAKNLCGLLYQIHDEDQVAGNFDDHNIFVNQDNFVLRLVDVDNMCFKDSEGKMYPPLGCNRMLCAPEIQDMRLGCSIQNYTKYSDLWTLAILIFKLLMANHHPFCPPVIDFPIFSKGQFMDQIERIKEGRTLFFKKEGYIDIPVEAPRLDWVFPETTVNLFRETFVDGHLDPTKRIGCKEWFIELNKLSKNLTTCPVNQSHVYYAGKSECPWCLIKDKVKERHLTARPIYPIVFIGNQTVSLMDRIKTFVSELREKLVEKNNNRYYEMAFVSDRMPIEQVRWLPLSSPNIDILDDFFNDDSTFSESLDCALYAIVKHQNALWIKERADEPIIIVLSDASINGYIKIFKMINPHLFLGHSRLIIVTLSEQGDIVCHDIYKGEVGNSCEWLVNLISQIQIQNVSSARNDDGDSITFLPSEPMDWC